MKFSVLPVTWSLTSLISFMNNLHMILFGNHWQMSPCGTTQILSLCLAWSPRLLKRLLRINLIDMHQAPPPWLVSWQRVVSRLKNLMMMALRTILQLVNLGIMPRSALQVFPPETHVRPSTTTCVHLQCRRYGNPHGRYAQCLTCETKWKWNPTEELWVQHGQRASSSRSQPLPPPCSATIATSLGAPKSKSRATAKIRPQPERRSPPTIRPRQSESWTTFGPTVMALDHLTEDQRYEVWQIVHQDSPLDGPHNTMAEHIFHNEETFREAREALERTADEARWTRLMELGVLTNPDDPIYDWDSVEPEVWS